MGEKGARSGGHVDEVAREILLSLEELEGIYNKKMFGGYGFFTEKGMFGILDSKGNFFLKADSQLKEKMIKQGSVQHSRMPYYSVSDHQDLLQLVREHLNTK